MEPNAAGVTAFPAFSVGSILSRTWRILLKKPFLFWGLTLMGTLVPAIVESLYPGSPSVNFAMRVLAMMLSLIFTGAIVYAAFRTLRGEPVSIGESISRGMARFAPLFGASLLASLGILVGSLLLIVPGLILMCVWSVIIPVCVVERLGVMDSMRRSAVLTRGYRWPIFALLLISIVFSVLVVWLVTFCAALFGNLLVLGIVMAVATAIPGAFQSVLTALIYYELRGVKEGVSLDNLANVFD